MTKHDFLKTPNMWLNNHRGWKMHDYEMKTALGLDPTRHLPADGLDWKLVGNVRVCIRPWRSTPPRAHRTFAECPMCMRIFTAGKIMQHFPACEKLEEYRG